MADFQIDLDNCDREPIHIPGQIQSHGFLLVINSELIIKFHSENIKDFIPGITIDLLGKRISYLESLIGQEQHQPGFVGQLINLGKHSNFEMINPFQVTISGFPYYLLISASAEYYLLEFEPAAEADEPNIQAMIGSSVAEVLIDKNLKSLLDNSTRQIKKIIGYDRVMIYRFAEDGHGEVVAEAKNDDLEAWLGLHYPASDIPKQARELYKLNLTRLIADVHTNPAKILTDELNRSPLDLTNAQLRAVSPVHIQYLKNMGVASSFSISLIYKKELWGLIACHNYTPKFINYRSRSSARLIGQILSSALEFRQDEENQQIHETFSNHLEKLSKYLQENDSVEEALINNRPNLSDVVNAGGVVLNYEHKRSKLGVTPNDEQLDQLILWMEEHITESIYHTNCLTAVYPQAAAFQEIGSGIFLCRLSRDLKEFIIWFKPEHLKTISWAGNPEKPVELNPDGVMQISPRHSFATWSQAVRGQSEEWKAEDIRSAGRLKEEIAYAVNQKAGAIRLMNEKLRQAYEELDTFSYTISHDLKNPLAIIKSYAQLLQKDQTISERGQSFILRIEDRANKMNQMIGEVLEYSRLGRSAPQRQTINMEELTADIVKDLKLVYTKAIIDVTIGETPDIQGDPVMMLQLFSNLIGNAVKYSQYSNPARVHISGAVVAGEILYSVKDNGLGIAATDLPHIFDLFNRMDNVKDIEGSGVGLAIVKRIVDKHKGKIWAESELGKGSAFFVSFNGQG
jgi:chemotaxis family two-component system sensor kinase Cph1